VKEAHTLQDNPLKLEQSERERRGGSGFANDTIFYWGGETLEHFCF
jgi:hypothetical protein